MNAQMKEVREEMIRMQKGFQSILERPNRTAEEKTRLWTKLELLNELLRFVDSRPETEMEMPKSVICKKTLVQYLEPKIEHLQRVVLIYVQDKCFDGGRLNAYKEILEDVKKM